ncbi:hypothetical protein OCU04_000939 [Sclerotinia nivalis]|uniref:Uncharacterized protein n=1 Tax=Sclerotinia nivalis TaxID=352851 RepID=A0A9X0AX52_9HELO|nr:hypothetical protein OCU04_000939 [Sclerotinia nivalis]
MHCCKRLFLCMRKTFFKKLFITYICFIGKYSITEWLTNRSSISILFRETSSSFFCIEDVHFTLTAVYIQTTPPPFLFNLHEPPTKLLRQRMPEETRIRYLGILFRHPSDTFHAAYMYCGTAPLPIPGKTKLTADCMKMMRF